MCDKNLLCLIALTCISSTFLKLTFPALLQMINHIIKQLRQCLTSVAKKRKTRHRWRACFACGVCGQGGVFFVPPLLQILRARRDASSCTAEPRKEQPLHWDGKTGRFLSRLQSDSSIASVPAMQDANRCVTLFAYRVGKFNFKLAS